MTPVNRIYVLFLTSLFSTAVFSQTLCDQKVYSAGVQDYDYVSFKPASLKQVNERRAAGVTIASIDRAQFLQKKFGVIPAATPFFSNQHINQFAEKLLHHPVNIYLKDETVNPSGSFKDRMPIRFYDQLLTEIDKVKKYGNEQKTQNIKLIAVSTGNHGRSVAYAANQANAYLKKAGLGNDIHVAAEITMSSEALPHKKAAIANLGAAIRDHDANAKPIPGYAEAEDLVLKDTQADPAHNWLLPHADVNSINGYAVMSVEMIAQAKNKGIDLANAKPGEIMMLVPLGSGGILSGTEEISARYPNVYSVGVTAAPADLTFRSLKQCKMIRSAQPYAGKLIVDGVMATPEEFSLERIRELAKGVELVRQEDAVYATALLQKNGIKIEPTSALPLAGMFLGVGSDFSNVRKVFIILTGKNISPDMQGEINKLAKLDEAKILAYFVRRRAEIAKALV